MKKPLTVTVCTSNRLSLLKSCLNSLLSQTASKRRYEILVIDNGHPPIPPRFKSGFPSVRFFRESKIGLSNARNTGWKISSGYYIAYIDDDAIAYPDWVAEILLFIDRHPHAQIFGGPYDRFATIRLPAWFPPDYGTSSLGSREKIIDVGREWLNGTNLIISKKLLASLHGFSPNLGMRGSLRRYGEETDLLLRAHKLNHPVYYSPSIKVKHLLAPHKTSFTWLIKDKFTVGQSIVKSHGRSDNLWYHLASFTQKTLFMVYYLLLPKSMPPKRRLYYALSGLASACGAFYIYFLKMINHV